jgi:hypothetical protein
MIVSRRPPERAVCESCQLQTISILTGRQLFIPTIAGLNRSSKPHGGSVASAALLTMPPGAPLTCASSCTSAPRDEPRIIRILEYPRRDRDVFFESDPSEGRVGIGIEADKDASVPPHGGEILAAREVTEGPVAALQDGFVPDNLAVDDHEGFNHLIDLSVVLKRQPSVAVLGFEVGFVLQRRSIDVRHVGLVDNVGLNLD